MLVKTPAVLDYRIRPTREGVEIVAVTQGAFDRDGLRIAVLRVLLAAGFTDPDVGVRVMPALERDPKTGKVRRVVPLA